MSKQSVIDVYLRARPVKNPSPNFKMLTDDNQCVFQIPKNPAQGYINNQIEKHTFSFAGVFGMETTQEEVFDRVAKEVIDSAIDGFNGTIFAYGQTGSGKTYTMTGNPEARSSAGIIPRTIYYLYDYARRESELVIDVTISYLEIYGGAGYDLLVADNRSRNLADLPKVQAMATANGATILQGLSLKKAQTEEDALNLLFIGEQNRVIAETPKNDASTRSHCIFIIILECRKPASDVKTVSKICLVDLSGSERIGNTGVEGLLQKEAVGINLSLHFLELVIDCLNRQAQGENVHIPYRDSMMTLILKDSLGGNCKTRMIATMSSDQGDIDESVCTCRFAGRVANIKNKVTRNEAVDPFIIIERLKRENAQLKSELAMVKGAGNDKDHLESYEIEDCKKRIDEFINSEDPSAMLLVNDHLKMNECFFQMKQKIKYLSKKDQQQQQQQQQQQESKSQVNQVSVQDQNKYQEEIQKLKQLVIQRDNEIMILLNMIQKGKQENGNQSLILQSNNELQSKLVRNETQIQSSQYQQSQFQPIEFPKQQELENSQIQQQKQYEQQQLKQKQDNNNNKQKLLQTGLDTDTTKASKEIKEVQSMLYEPVTLSNEQLMDRNQALDMFRKSYRKGQAMEELKQGMQEKIIRSKELAGFINKQRDKINQIKNKIEQSRKERVLLGLVNNQNEGNQEEDELMQEYNQQKDQYKQCYEELKGLKVEIERIQFLLQKNREKMQQDFERWLDVMLKQRNISLQQTSLVSDLKSMQQSGDQNVNSMVQQFYKNKEICNQLLQQ